MKGAQYIKLSDDAMIHMSKLVVAFHNNPLQVFIGDLESPVFWRSRTVGDLIIITELIQESFMNEDGQLLKRIHLYISRC